MLEDSYLILDFSKRKSFEMKVGDTVTGKVIKPMGSSFYLIDFDKNRIKTFSPYPIQGICTFLITKITGETIFLKVISADNDPGSMQSHRVNFLV